MNASSIGQQPASFNALKKLGAALSVAYHDEQKLGEILSRTEPD